MARLDRCTCDEALQRLEDFLDRELSPDETFRVQAHLDICAPCTRRFRYEASLLDGIRDCLRRVQLPPDLLTRIERLLDDGGGT